MPNINFPANPTQGQEYTFNNFKYIFNGNRWQSARNDSSSDLDYFKKDLSAPGSKVVIAGMEAKDFIDQKDGIPATAVMWFPSRDTNHEGFIPADGQLLSRALYPSLWKAIEDRKVPVVTDSSWVDNVDTRGSYTTGDGSTTFRVPDYNGKISGGKGSAFLRGDGLNAGNVGHVQGDAIRNIKGSSTKNGFSILGTTHENYPDSPIFTEQNGGTRNYGSTAASADWGNSIGFDASRSVPTADENRPVNVAGVWMIKAFSYVENEGVVDAGHLATALADAEAKISALESRRITQVVDVLWEGFSTHADALLHLSQPLVAGDMLTVEHNDNAKLTTAVVSLVPNKMVAEQVLYFPFSSTATTSLKYVDENTLKTSIFTTGYAISKVYRTRYALV